MDSTNDLKTSDEILKELFDSLNVPTSPKNGEMADSVSNSGSPDSSRSGTVQNELTVISDDVGVKKREKKKKKHKNSGKHKKHRKERRISSSLSNTFLGSEDDSRKRKHSQSPTNDDWKVHRKGSSNLDSKSHCISHRKNPSRRHDSTDSSGRTRLDSSRRSEQRQKSRSSSREGYRRKDCRPSRSRSRSISEKQLQALVTNITQKIGKMEGVLKESENPLLQSVADENILLSSVVPELVSNPLNVATVELIPLPIAVNLQSIPIPDVSKNCFEKKFEALDKLKPRPIVIKDLKDSTVFQQVRVELEKKTSELEVNNENDSVVCSSEMKESTEDEVKEGKEDTASKQPDKALEDGEISSDGTSIEMVNNLNKTESSKSKSEKKKETKEWKRSHSLGKSKQKSRSPSTRSSHSNHHYSKSSRSSHRSKSRSHRSRSRGHRSRSRGHRSRSRSHRSRSRSHRSRSKSRSHRHKSDDHGHRRDKSDRDHSSTTSHRSGRSDSKKSSSSNNQDHRDFLDALRDKVTRRKLLEIARRNAVHLMETGGLPTLVEQEQLVKLKTGGKSVQELTEFCKDLVTSGQCSGSEKDSDVDLSSDEEDRLESRVGGGGCARHPFIIRDRPIMMNIRNAPMVPTKSNAERLADQSKLREQFPVSSGSQHRTKESGWVPVEKEKEKKKEEDKVFPEAKAHTLDVSTIVSNRLSAMRKLQDNPHDVIALNTLHEAQNRMENWALSKQLPGQFIGSTGAKVMSQEELNSGFQAWARKEQLKDAAPVSSMFGMKMLQKMGWAPGEGLGRNKEGTTQPLMLDVKMDKKGFHSQEETAPKKTFSVATGGTLAGKHPVSALMEVCSKKHWGAPEFELLMDAGPDHKKNFLMKVKINGQEFRPTIFANTKKVAKANAAAACLQSLGILPRNPGMPI